MKRGRRKSKLKNEVIRKTGQNAGLVYVYVPDHPKAFDDRTHNIGYYYKHIVMMERKLGRYLDKHETVKFKDGNKANCRIDNLYLVNNGHKQTNIGKYKWVILCYVYKDAYTKMATIAEYLANYYPELMEVEDRKPTSTYYLVRNCMQWLRKEGYTKYVGRRTRYHYCTPKGAEEAMMCIKDGRSHDIYVEIETGVLI